MILGLKDLVSTQFGRMAILEGGMLKAVSWDWRVGEAARKRST